VANATVKDFYPDILRLKRAQRDLAGGKGLGRIVRDQCINFHGASHSDWLLITEGGKLYLNSAIIDSSYHLVTIKEGEDDACLG
jgi:hypothetical protein